MKKFDFTRIIFLITSFLILIAGFVRPDGNIKTSIVGASTIISLVILKLSEENPKIKTLRFLNRLTLFIIVICSIFTLLLPIETLFVSRNNEILTIGLVSIFMMVFGNLSPKIPFNRYFGLRLPWTIRDEQTWRIAHKIVGYLSFPIALIMFTLSFFFNSDKVAITCGLTWVAIPSIYSFIFYYKKYRYIK